MTRGIIEFLKDERGMISMVNAVAVAFCAVLITLIINVGHIAHQKIETQDSADAVAYSGAVWKARGMNAVTATNHVMGEMMGFVILHEAMGGQRLEHPEMGPADTRRPDAALDSAYHAAHGMGASTPAYSVVRQREGIYADRTLLDSKIKLKKWLTHIYRMKAIAKAMQQSSFPPIVAAGVALETSMNAFEVVILAEYKVLLSIHRTAVSLLEVKRLLRDRMLPNAKQYTTYVVNNTPAIAQRAAELIAEKNRTRGTLFPLRFEMPLVVDPFATAAAPNVPNSQRVAAPRPGHSCPSDQATNMRDQVVKTSQLARASWPWVNYHRQPILNTLGALLPFAQARKHYFHHTAGAAKYLCDVLQTDHHDLGLYVLKGYPAPDKGYALWTDDPVLADNHFTVMGLAYRSRTMVIGEPAIYQQQHPEGRIAYAQAIVYNANAQRPHPHHHNLNCKRIQPIRQADVGWDTLNWKPGTRPYELIGIGAGIHAEFPKVKVNWQAKLVPVTANRYAQMRATDLPQPFAGVAEKLLPTLPQSLRTH